MITFSDENGPINFFIWGEYIINGEKHSEEGNGCGKDIAIINDQVKTWKERKGHNITKEMIEPYIKDIDYLIIGNGVKGLLEFPNELLKELDSIEIKIIATPSACLIYNEERKKNPNKKICLLAHGTC